MLDVIKQADSSAGLNLSQGLLLPFTPAVNCYGFNCSLKFRFLIRRCK